MKKWSSLDKWKVLQQQEEKDKLKDKDQLILERVRAIGRLVRLICSHEEYLHLQKRALIGGGSSSNVSSNPAPTTDKQPAGQPKETDEKDASKDSEKSADRKGPAGKLHPHACSIRAPLNLSTLKTVKVESWTRLHTTLTRCRQSSRFD